ncbi:hypothetical protein LXA47_01825 [Massilia sp. P8910]|uniref:hypothetical protein n=1 Tax=Massilia antarctica TaxID=2765360 RepID=UPI000AC8DDCC|nr:MULTISPECIES: hypothetical protein [Massilia]MCE3602352.1 hypothetical protein [Massilia antarctica]MCY0912526.1 hypothetical protein [Massilia sp. H27-R4]
MKPAFDEDAAMKLLRQQEVPEDLAHAALAGRYERRQDLRRRTMRLLGNVGRLPSRDLN